MKKDKKILDGNQQEGLSVEQIARVGAQLILKHALEAEILLYLSRYSTVQTPEAILWLKG